MTDQRIVATYHVSATAADIDARAHSIAIEQSIECPLDAVGDPAILDAIVGRVDGIADIAPGRYAVRIALAAATLPPEPGQMLNMLFGNTSIQDDVVLADVELPPNYLSALGGPRLGLPGIRALTGAHGRALTASALKPQGLPPEALARIAYELALGGLDLIKDDHGLADQHYSPFAARVAAVGRAVREANQRSAADTGHASADGSSRRTIYAPNISGTLDDMRRQLAVVRAEGVEGILVAPMIVGVANFHAIAKEAEGLVVMTHPALAGAARFAPPLLLGRLFRLFGADATVYPNFGGRFAYSAATCHALARAALDPWGTLKPSAPMPAGGMTVARVPELLDFYGPDVVLLIGGSLLSARDRLRAETSLFVRKVAEHAHR